MSEVFEDFIPYLKHKVGFLKSVPYHLILTNERLIFAQNTKAVQKAAQAALLQEMKGKSLKERMMTGMAHNAVLFDQYKAMSIDEILAQTPGNFTIPRHTLLKVRTSIGAGLDENNQPTNGTITLTTTTGKMVFKGTTIQDGERAYHALKRAIKGN